MIFEHAEDMSNSGNSSTHQPIIIAGMHRSGTSLTASVLEEAGINIGEELLGPGTGNDKGHFEDVDVLSLHQKILISQGISAEGWTSLSRVYVPQQFWGQAKELCKTRSAQALIWGWKEPRTTLFLDFWENLLPNAKFVFVYRSPWEVMDSLFARGDVAFHHNPKFALDVWMAYNQAILSFLHHHSEKTFLLHPLSLGRDETHFIAQLAEKFDLSLTPPKETLFQAENMHLQVNSTHRPALVANYFPQALEIYQRLEDIADLPSQIKLDTVLLHASKDSYEDWVFQDWLAHRKAMASLKETQSELHQVQTELQQSQTELHQLREDLHRSQADSQHSQAELQQSQIELQQSQTELQHSQVALQQVQAELQQSRDQLQQTQAELHDAQTQLNQAELMVQSMESSKFWRLRTYWTSLKGLVPWLFSKFPSP